MEFHQIKFMKKYITKLIILFFIFEVCAEVYPKVDYMMLTRKSVPPMKILVDATIETMGINLNSDEAVKKIRNSALLPDFTARWHYYPEGLSKYDELYYLSSERTDSNGGYNFETVEEFKQVGFNERSEWAVTFEWNLTKLMYSHEERNLSSRQVQLASLNRRRTVDVARRYSQLIAALPLDNNDEVDYGKMAIIYENALILDVWTGGLLTKVIQDTEQLNRLLDTLD